MRVLLASPLGFLIGVALGALGGGGSILAVPALVYAAGQDLRTATATSLLLVGTAALIGMAAHYRAGRVRVGTGIAFGLIGVGGSILGTILHRRLDPDVLLLGFSVLTSSRRDACSRRVRPAPASASNASSRKPRQGARTRRVTPRRISGSPSFRRLDGTTVAKIAATGTVVGFFTGLFGVGGGFVNVPH